MKLEDVRKLVGLSSYAAEKTFDSFEQKRQPKGYQKARAFLENRKSLVFHGPNGTGKTHLAYAIVNALLEDSCYLTGIWTQDDMGGVVKFATFDDLLRLLRSTYKDGYEGMGEEWYMERWRTVPVLVLDEVGMAGRQEASEFTRRIGYDIVDGRYRQGDKPIIITTNKTAGELCEWITKSAVDRLFEMGEFVEFTGKSYRLEQKGGR